MSNLRSVVREPSTLFESTIFPYLHVAKSYLFEFVVCDMAVRVQEWHGQRGRRDDDDDDDALPLITTSPDLAQALNDISSTRCLPSWTLDFESRDEFCVQIPFDSVQAQNFNHGVPAFAQAPFVFVAIDKDSKLLGSLQEAANAMIEWNGGWLGRVLWVGTL